MFWPNPETRPLRSNELRVPDAYGWKPPVLDELRDKAITAREAERYLAALQAEADTFRTSVRASITRASLLAGQRLKHAVTTWRQARDRTKARAAVAATFAAEGLTPLALGLLGLAVLVIQAAEYVFTWTVLPMVIGIRQHSVEGHTVAALAVAALLTLEFVFASLGVARSRRVVDGAPLASARRWTTALAAGGFTLGLLMLLLLNLSMVDQIAVLREVGASVGVSTDVFQIDRKAMGWAMRNISLAVAIDGGILLVLFESERQRRMAHRRLQEAHVESAARERDVREAFAQWQTLRHLAQERVAIAENAKATFMTEAELRVEQAKQRAETPEPKTLQERVARLIGHPAV